MNVFIGHTSALEYWRSISLELPGAYERSHCAPRSRSFLGRLTPEGELLRLENRKDYLPKSLYKTPSFLDCKPSLGILREVEICGSGCFSAPISFIVSKASQRWRSREVVCHVCKEPFPAGSFVRLASGIYVASPELCFVQMATALSLSHLLLLGYELCGTYSTREGEYAQRPPLSNVARLAAFLDKAGSLRGAPKARRALKYLSNASASPKESSLALLLGLPCSMGGYGFGIPVMNQRVAFTKSARKTSSSSARYVDLYWPDANLGVEYDSDKEHTGSEKIARDASRKNALFAAGVNILTVTKGQIMSESEMDKVSCVIAKHMGVYMRSKNYNEGLRRKRLRWELLH